MNRDVPYTATIVPLPDGDSLAARTESFRSAMNVSTMEIVSRCDAHWWVDRHMEG